MTRECIRSQAASVSRVGLFGAASFLLVAWCCTLAAAQDADAGPGARVWVPAMKMVHERFTGEQGTLALFGDSITASKAFCFGLQYAPDGDDREMLQALGLVKSYMLQDC